jgi:hypothetical protein
MHRINHHKKLLPCLMHSPFSTAVRTEIRHLENKSDFSESLELLNADKQNFREFGRTMNTKYLAVVAALAVMLIGATALATTDNAFADKKRHDDKKKGGYEKSQALSQATSCGNGVISVADFCQDIGSQNQGKENSVAQSGNQEINIGVELGGEPLTSSLLGEPASSLIPEEPQ